MRVSTRPLWTLLGSVQKPALSLIEAGKSPQKRSRS